MRHTVPSSTRSAVAHVSHQVQQGHVRQRASMARPREDIGMARHAGQSVEQRARAACDDGTRCSCRVFIREAGTVQMVQMARPDQLPRTAPVGLHWCRWRPASRSAGPGPRHSGFRTNSRRKAATWGWGVAGWWVTCRTREGFGINLARWPRQRAGGRGRSSDVRRRSPGYSRCAPVHAWPFRSLTLP